MQEEHYFTPTQAADKIIGKPHFRTVLRMIKSGKIGAIEIQHGARSHYKIPESEITKYNKSIKLTNE